jgi:hypothetical protein
MQELQAGLRFLEQGVKAGDLYSEFCSAMREYDDDMSSKHIVDQIKSCAERGLVEAMSVLVNYHHMMEEYEDMARWLIRSLSVSEEPEEDEILQLQELISDFLDYSPPYAKRRFPYAVGKNCYWFLEQEWIEKHFDEDSSNYLELAVTTYCDVCDLNVRCLVTSLLCLKTLLPYDVAKLITKELKHLNDLLAPESPLFDEIQSQSSQ